MPTVNGKHFSYTKKGKKAAKKFAKKVGAHKVKKSSTPSPSTHQPMMRDSNIMPAQRERKRLGKKMLKKMGFES